MGLARARRIGNQEVTGRISRPRMPRCPLARHVHPPTTTVASRSSAVRYAATSGGLSHVSPKTVGGRTDLRTVPCQEGASKQVWMLRFDAIACQSASREVGKIDRDADVRVPLDHRCQHMAARSEERR